MRLISSVCVLLAAFAGKAAAAEDFPTRGDLIGELGVHVIEPEEVLHDVARRYDLGYNELRGANPTVDPWLPGDGTMVTLPTVHLLPNTARRGIVINLSEQRLYYFRGKQGEVTTFPVGIATQLRDSRMGTTEIVRKHANPTWYPPASILEEEPYLPKFVPPGPDNPLGAFALYLAWDRYLIHGTNKPDGVGRRVSHGCIRMYPEDIQALYAMAGVGTSVTFVDQPIKVGWSDGALYLEAHPTQEEADQVEVDGAVSNPSPLDARQLILAKAAGFDDRIDWPLVERIVRERRGIPVRITR